MADERDISEAVGVIDLHRQDLRRQLSASSCQLSAVSFRLSAISFQPEIGARGGLTRPLSIRLISAVQSLKAGGARGQAARPEIPGKKQMILKFVERNPRRCEQEAPEVRIAPPSGILPRCWQAPRSGRAEELVAQGQADGAEQGHRKRVRSSRARRCDFCHTRRFRKSCTAVFLLDLAGGCKGRARCGQELIAVGGQPVASCRKLEAGSWELEAGSWQPLLVSAALRSDPAATP